MSQIDLSVAESYPELQSVIRRAREQQYVDWEILDWLVTPYILPIDEPGENPLPGNTDASPSEVMDVILARHAARPALEAVAPIDLLRNGRIEEFQIHVRDWLGN